MKTEKYASNKQMVILKWGHRGASPDCTSRPPARAGGLSPPAALTARGSHPSFSFHGRRQIPEHRAGLRESREHSAEENLRSMFPPAENRRLPFRGHELDCAIPNDRCLVQCCNHLSIASLRSISDRTGSRGRFGFAFSGYPSLARRPPGDA